jgi:putative membrane protein
MRRPTAAVVLLPLAAGAGAHENAPLAPHDLWSTWNDDWWLWLAIALAGWLYAQGVRRLWRNAGHGAGIGAARAAAYALGWLALALALLSPLDPLGSMLFSAHMVQHELLMLVAAPLLVLGQPLAAFVWALPVAWREPAGWACKASGLQAALRALSRPAVAWSVHAAALWAWHAPALFEAAVRHESVHMLQHASFFASALLFWWSLLGARAGRREGAALLYLFTTALHGGALGALLTMAGRPWYGGVYQDGASPWGFTPLEDQQLGGLIMWVPAGLVYLGAALALLASWLSWLAGDTSNGRRRTYRPSGARAQLPGLGQYVTEQQHEAGKHEELVDEPVRFPDSPLRREQELAQLGHHDHDLRDRHPERQRVAVALPAQQRPSEPHVHDRPEVRVDVAADRRAFGQRVGHREQILDDHGPGRENEQEVGEEVEHGQRTTHPLP